MPEHPYKLPVMSGNDPTFLSVVATKSLIPGYLGIEEAQWVLRDVLCGHHPVVADDFGQWEPLKHLLGVGLH